MEVFASFWMKNLVELYVIYGIAFILLGVAIYLLPRNSVQIPISVNFGLLSAFGILHGFSELFEARLRVMHTTGTSFAWFGALFLILSFLPLSEFARRCAAQQASSEARWRWLTLPWTYIPIAGALFYLAVDYSSSGLSAGGRYLLCLPSALVTGLAFIRIPSLASVDDADQLSKLTLYSYAAGGAFMVYAIAAGVFNSAFGGEPAWLPTDRAFLAATGVPIQLLRAGCALVAVVAVSKLVRLHLEHSMKRERTALQELRSLTASLEERVKARTADLNIANRNLQQEIVERDQITQRVLHLNRLLNTVVGINPALLSAKDEMQLYAATCDCLVEQGGFKMAWVGLAIPEDFRVQFAYQRGFDPEYFKTLDVRYDDGPLGKGPTGTAIRSGRTVVNDDSENNVLFAPWREMARQLGYRSSAAIPLRVGNQVMGSLNAYAEAPYAFAGEELVVLEKLAGDLGLAIERLRAELAIYAAEGREREQRLLAESEHGRMTALLSAMSIGILFEDRESRIEYVNPAFRNIWAIPDDLDLTDRPALEVLEHSTHRLARPDHASKFVLQVVDTNEISERFEIDLCDGRILTQINYPVNDADGRIIGRLWIYEDVTHERQTATQLLYLAERDALTGLYNRHRFQERLEQLIAGAARSGTRFSLLYFDLDEFKYINDTYGHRAGDTVLVRMAGEIKNLVRNSDIFARLGGDEFAIVTPLLDGDDLSALPKRIVSAASAIPLRFRGSNLRLTASIGIAVFPDHGNTAEDLVAHADTAMYQAKRQGKNTWFVYDPSRDLSEAMAARLSWSRRISHALEDDLFELHFQGVYDAADLSVSHLEVLIRMRDSNDPERLIMPNQFIAHAEKSGQIIDIDRWVIRRSIELLKMHPHLQALAINVSGRSVDEPSLPHYITAQLDEYGVDPRRLIVELTETAAVSDVQDAQRFIEALQRNGCRVALDDFGSGFSTFAYLKHLAVEILKIDGLFIRDLFDNPDNQAIVKAMVEVAHGLRKTTIAESVEDQATFNMVRDLGVGFVQGYYLDRPSGSIEDKERRP